MKKTVVEKVRSSESVISMVLGIIVVLVVGILLFNYFKGILGNSKKELPETSTSEENQVTATPSAEENEWTGKLPTKYTVVKGDSLWTISQKFYGSGYNWVDIAKENKINNSDILAIGLELTIPDVPVKKPINQQNTSTGNSVKPIEGTSYTIEKGDSLWSISVRAYQDGYKWTEIAKANNIVQPNIIHPGNTLTIPR